MNKPLYICLEGVEGSFKTTNAKALAEYVRSIGLTVLETKEPGTSNIQLTMKLREIMLSNEFDSEMTAVAREFISQAIRSIHLENLVSKSEVDVIIQDRGTLSGKAYAEALGHSSAMIDLLTMKVTQTMPAPQNRAAWNIYDRVILLVNDPAAGLEIASAAKKEYSTGDAMEAKGHEFMKKVLQNMLRITEGVDNVHVVDVRGKTPDQILDEIIEGIK